MSYTIEIKDSAIQGNPVVNKIVLSNGTNHEFNSKAHFKKG